MARLGNSLLKSPIGHNPKPSIISPEPRFEAGFYTRRFGPHESIYISRFENRDPGRFQGIKRKNRLKRFQIENDSQKGGYHYRRIVPQTRLRGWVLAPYALNQLKTKYRTCLDPASGMARMNCLRTVVASLPALTTSKGPITDSGVSTETMNGA